MRSGSPCNGQPEAYLREEEAEQGADGVPEVKAMAVVDEEDEGVRLYGVQHHRGHPGRRGGGHRNAQRVLAGAPTEQRGRCWGGRGPSRPVTTKDHKKMSLLCGCTTEAEFDRPGGGGLPSHGKRYAPEKWAPSELLVLLVPELLGQGLLVKYPTYPPAW